MTLMEIIIGSVILSMIFSIVARWFFLQRNYSQRVTQISETQENFRRASWTMIKEMQKGRLVIWPTINADKSLHSDSKVVFKNFSGQFVSFYHDPGKGEIRRCVIPNGPGVPQEDPKPLAVGIASVSFTASDVESRYIAIHLSANGAHALDGVYLLNND